MALQKLKKLASERLPVLSEEEQDLQELDNIEARQYHRKEKRDRLMQSWKDRPKHNITKEDILSAPKPNKLNYNE